MMIIMPWSSEHKKETKQRIVEAAAAALRKGGLADTSVADIMQRAGLTHGGFYAHFKSKDDLVSEAYTLASLSVANSDGANAYLAKGHMLHPEIGCPVAALGTEMVRGSAKVRRAFGDGIRRRLKRLAARFEGQPDSEIKASGALACMVGAMIIARGLPENEGAAMLQRARAFLKETIGEEIL